MAADLRYSSPPLKRQARAAYADFNVFQLMRLLSDGAEGFDDNRLRFRADLGAAFPGREITKLSIESKSGNERIVLHTPNYCVASELGPLPAPFLEWVREQQRDGAGAMAAFLNLFNQRIHTLRYALKRRSVRALDPAGLPERTQHAYQLAALLGLAQRDAQDQIPLPPRAWLGLAGLLVNPKRSAAVIATVMSRYLGVRTRVEPLIGAWRDIEKSEQIALGKRNHRLGKDSLLGRRILDGQASVRLEVDPLDFERLLPLLPLRAPKDPDAESLLPPSRYAGLSAMLHLLLDRRYDCTVEFRLKAYSIPVATLVSKGVGLRLGQTAWLKSAASDGESRLELRIPAHADDMGARA